MSNVSIYDKSWLDLVFENKNKAYGAYQLRQENSKTTLLALLGGIVFVFSVSGLGMLLSSFSNSPDVAPLPPNSDPLIVQYVLPFKKRTEPKVTKPQPQKQKAPDNLSHMVVTATEHAQANVPTNDNMDTTPVSTEISSGTGAETTPTVASPSIPVDTGKESEPTRPGLLDKLPSYPGGISQFYSYVGTHFERPEIDEATTITVYVSFVIEKDGSMTDIKVLRNPGYGMDKEAIRVLQSLKVKWSPGIKDGQKMRTLYTLPIKVQTE